MTDSTPTTTAPRRVVSVVNAPAKGGYSYRVAAVYELVARKADGVETYRRDGVNRALPHRSKKQAYDDAEEISEELGIPFWPGVRFGTTAQGAVERQRKIEEKAARK